MLPLEPQPEAEHSYANHALAHIRALRTESTGLPAITEEKRMTIQSDLDVSKSRVARRTVLRGGLLGSAGLAAAALFGCKSSSKPADTATSVAPAASAAPKQKLLNEDLLVFNDPKLPFPHIAPAPDLPVKKGGTYVFGWLYDIASMDPSTASSVSSGGIPSAVGEHLVEYVHGARQNPLKVEIEPGLARSWEVSPDGMTYTFKLTDKAKYHNKPPVNGRAFTAEDARLVYERYAATGVARGNYTSVEKMTTVNPTTFQVKMKMPKPDFLPPLASREAVIYAIELAAGGTFSKTDQIGTGAFILSEATPGQRVKLTGNKEYWQGAPHLDGQEWRMMPDESARLAAFRAGQIDTSDTIIRDVKSAEALRASNPDAVITLSPVVAGSTAICYNMKNPKFKDERVRQALMLGYDRERHIQLFNNGLGSPYLQVLPWIFLFDRLPSQTEVSKWARYDVAEAKKLLAAAGAQDLTFELLRSASYTTDSEFAFQLESMKTIGVNAVGKTVDNTSWNSQWQTGTYTDSVSRGINTAAYTADGFFRDQLETGAGLNRINLSDSQIDDWAKQQSSELNPQKRRDLQRKIWDRMGDQAFRLEGPGSNSFFVRQGWLRNASVGGPFASICTCAAGQYMHQVWLNK